MATSNSTLAAQSNHKSAENGFNLHLGHLLFSDPSRDRSGAVVVANHSDETAGIDAGDLVRIDFTENKIYEGLYVVTLDDGWIGYKFFQRMPSLHVREYDGMHAVTPKMIERIKVVGKVKDIYRSKSNAPSGNAAPLAQPSVAEVAHG